MKPTVRLALSMLIFGTIGIFRRFIPLSSGLLAFARGVIGAAFLCLWVKCRGGRILHGLSRDLFLKLVISGALIGINWMLLFEAFNYTTVATATLCYYMQPTIVLLLSPIVFGEKLTPKKLLCAAVSLAGMFFVSGVVSSLLAGTGAGLTGGAEDTKGILFGLGAAALYAAVVIMNKKITGVDAYEKTIIQLASAAAVMVPYLAVTGQLVSVELEPLSAGMLLVMGLVHTGIAYAMYFGSTETIEAQTIAVFSYIDPVSSLIFAAAILHEPMGVTGVIGAAMILGAAAVSELS